MKAMINKFLPRFANPTFWLSLWRDIRLSLKVVRDPRVPIYLKIIPIFVAIYVVSPLDFIPGVIPFVGQIDDVALMILGLQLFIRLVPADVLNDYRTGPQGE